MPQELITTAETAWLRRINRFQRFNGGGGVNPDSLYNTVESYLLESGDTQSFTASTYHDIQFSVISGEISVSIDGDSTTYPAGYNGGWKATTLIVNLIEFSVGVGDNQVIIQAIKA